MSHISVLRMWLVALSILTGGAFAVRAATPAASPLDAPIETARKALTDPLAHLQTAKALLAALPGATGTADDAGIASLRDGAAKLKDANAPALYASLKEDVKDGSALLKARDGLDSAIKALPASTTPAVTTPAATTTPAAAPAGAAPTAPAPATAPAPPLTPEQALALARSAEADLKKALDALAAGPNGTMPSKNTLDAIRSVVRSLTGDAGDQLEQTARDVYEQLKALAGSGSDKVEQQIKKLVTRLRGQGISAPVQQCGADPATGSPTPAPDPKLPDATTLLTQAKDTVTQIQALVAVDAKKGTAPFQDGIAACFANGKDLTTKLAARLTESKLPTSTASLNGESLVTVFVKEAGTFGAWYLRAIALAAAQAKLPEYAAADAKAVLGDTAAGAPGELKTAAAALKSSAENAATAVPAALGAMNTYTSARISVLTELAKQVRASLRKQAAAETATGKSRDADADATDALLLVKTPEAQDQARVLVGNLRQVETAWLTSAEVLKETASLKELLSRAEEARKSLGATRDLLAGAVDLLDETLGGDRQHWVSEQVRLFYFTDVVRLMYTLNTETRVQRPEGLTYETEATKLRKQLRATEASLFSKRGEVSDGKTQLENLRTELQLAQATAQAAAKTKARAADALAQLQGKQAAAAKRLADAIADTSTPAATLASLKKASADLDSAVDAQTKLKAQADANDADAAAQLARLQDDKTGLPAKIEQAERDVKSLQGAVRALEVEAAAAAQDESDAFAQARDNAQFYFAPAHGASTDPVHRVEMYAYNDSKILFIRGLASDVERVKDIIAGFDRPAPQARITLWTLQLNAHTDQSAKKQSEHLNDSFTAIDQQLRHMRGAITMVQEALRNSINREVNLVAQRDRSILEQTGCPMSERAYRYFYFPEEIRRRLGFDPPLPRHFREMEALATLQADVASTRVALRELQRESVRIFGGSDADGVSYVPERKTDAARDTPALENKRDYVLGLISALQIKLQGLDSIADLLGKSDTRYQPFIVDSDWTPILNKVRFEVDKKNGASRNDSSGTKASMGNDPNQSDALRCPPAAADGELARCKNRVADICTLLNPLLEVAGRNPSKVVCCCGKHSTMAAVFAQGRKELSSPITRGMSFKCLINYLDLVDRRTSCALKDLIAAVSSQSRGGGKTPLCREGNGNPQQVMDVEYLTRWTLTDPSHCTTLGETLFVASLARRSLRTNIINGVATELQDILRRSDANSSSSGTGAPPDGLYGVLLKTLTSLLPGQGASLGTDEQSTNGSEANEGNQKTKNQEKERGNFDFFRIVFGASADTSAGLDDGELTANQLEVLLAMQTKARETVSAVVHNLLRRMDNLPKGEREGPDGIAWHFRSQYLPLVGWLRSGHAQDLGVAQPAGRIPWSYQGLLATASNPSKCAEQARLRMDRAAWELAALEGSRNSLARATPRVAAADEMIKRMIVVAENDLEEHVIAPHLKTIREQVHNNRIELGTVQRESILATNRLVARVDPRASADLEVATQSSLMDAAAQLGNLVQAAQQTGALQTQQNKILNQSNQDKKAGSSALITGSLAKSVF